MNIELKVGHVTLYAQLARIFRDQLYSGVYKEGQDFPTLDELATQYNVARVTVRQAIQILSNEGHLSSQRGRRTFVSYRRPSPEIGPLYSSVGSIESSPGAISINVLDRRRVEGLPINIENEGVASADGYMRIQKVDSASDVPYIWSQSFISLPLFRCFPRGSEKRIKLFRLVRDYAETVPLIATEQIRIAMPEPEEAEKLQISMSVPVARLTRFVKDSSRQILFFGNHVYRGDLFLIERDISTALVREK